MDPIGDPVLFTIATVLIEHWEFLLFNDGHLELEDPLCAWDSTLSHVHLDKPHARALRTFLNQPEVATLLEQ